MAPYGNRTDRELEAIWALETSIAGVSSRFRGEYAFDYSHEAEVAAYLLVALRESFGSWEPVGRTNVQLSRLEWRCVGRHDIDLVIVHPDAANLLRRSWGTVRSVGARSLPLLAAVEIKRGGGDVPAAAIVSRDLAHLDQVHGHPDLGHPVSYMLAWIDSDLKTRPKQWPEYRQVQDQLRNWCGSSPENRRALLLSRDRVGAAFPKNSWLVLPLPPGTVNSLPASTPTR